MVIKKCRKIVIRADNIKQARKFAESHRKVFTNKFLPEKITSVKLNKSSGLAGGIKGYSVGLCRKEDKRQRIKGGRLASRFRGKKPRL